MEPHHVASPLAPCVCDRSTLQVSSLFLLSEEHFLWGALVLVYFPMKVNTEEPNQTSNLPLAPPLAAEGEWVRGGSG